MRQVIDFKAVILSCVLDVFSMSRLFDRAFRGGSVWLCAGGRRGWTGERISRTFIWGKSPVGIVAWDV